MIALEHKAADTVPHIPREVQVNCLQNRGFPCSLQYTGIPIEGFHELKDGIHGHLARDVVEPDKSENGDSFESHKETLKKPIHQHEFSMFSSYYPESPNLAMCHMNAVEAHFYPCLVDNRIRYAPLNMIPQSYPQFQDFQYFVVIDFEATCDKEKNPHPQEIIEFPSVIVSSITGQLEACFQTYVRPTRNLLLTDFCKELTGIQQIQVDRGITLSEALLKHDKWLEKKGIKNTNFAVVTWSNWDCQVMLESECRFKKIRKPPYFNKWINLKVPFGEVFRGARCNLKEAVQMAGLTWQGRAHCGLDDAKNTARLLATLMHWGFKFSITNSLMCQPTDETFTWKLPHPDHPSFPAYQPQKIRTVHVPVLQLHRHCFCGVKSSKGMVRKPGPKHGSLFFGCGNWTASRGPRCNYFEWSSI